MNAPLPENENIHTVPGALKALQDDIYQEKILRARKMTTAERFEEVLSLSNSMFGRMLSGAMNRVGTNDIDAGWREVRRWMDRLDRMRDFNVYVSEKPSES